MDSLRSPTASQFRRQGRVMERIERRIALADMPGKVIPGSQDYETRTVRLDLGRSADGRVIKGPKVGWQQAGAGKARLHTPPKDDEQMRLRSPSGTVGTGSLAQPATFDQDTGPPSKSGDEAVLDFGERAKITMREDALRLEIGASSIAMTEDRVTIVSPEIHENPDG